MTEWVARGPASRQSLLGPAKRCLVDPCCQTGFADFFRAHHTSDGREVRGVHQRRFVRSRCDVGNRLHSFRKSELKDLDKDQQSLVPSFRGGSPMEK